MNNNNHNHNHNDNRNYSFLQYSSDNNTIKRQFNENDIVLISHPIHFAIIMKLHPVYKCVKTCQTWNKKLKDYQLHRRMIKLAFTPININEIKNIISINDAKCLTIMINNYNGIVFL